MSPATCRYPGFFLFAAAVDPPFSSIQLARVAPGATGRGWWVDLSGWTSLSGRLCNTIYS